MKVKVKNIIIEFIEIINNLNNDKLIDTLNNKELITANVEYRYLKDLQSSKIKIDKIESINDNRYCCFIDIDNLPYKTIILTNHSKLKIDSFEFLCMSCFNDKMLNKNNCEVCGGSGWGVL